jgi:plasmid rolling circle replication initiator protein Rep
MNNINSSAALVKLVNVFAKKNTKKRGAEILGFAYEKTKLSDAQKKAHKLRMCGSQLVYGIYEDDSYELLAGYFCQLRLCPQCSWFRATRIFDNVHRIITQPEFAGKQFIFLTLTVKNCEGEFLESEIKRLLTAWGKLTNIKKSPFRKAFLGTFRALEVTYNKMTKTYHPHLHAMAAVGPGYFRKSNKNYIDQARLRELWRDACGLDYLPQCRIQRVKNATEKQVAEVAKYTVKSADYINRPEVVQVLDPALRRKRLIAYGGLFGEVRKRLNLPDEDKAGPDIPQEKAFAAFMNPCIQKILFEWRMGTYHVSQIENMTAEGVINAADRLAGEILDNYFGQPAGAGGQGV